MEPALRMAVWRPHVSEETSRRSKNNWGSAKTTPMLAIKPGVQPLPQAGVAPHRQLVPRTAASLPRRLLHTGGGSKGPSVTAHTHRYSTLLA